MSFADFNQVARLERNLFSHDFRLSREQLIKKLENLQNESSMNNPIYAPRFTHGPTLVNLSFKTLEPLEIQTLEKGPKFSFLPKQVPMADLISSLESSLHKSISIIHLLLTQTKLGLVLLIHIINNKKKRLI